MCCANRTFWFNLVLWVLALLGLAPVAEQWASTFEHWTGVSLVTQSAIVMEYGGAVDDPLHAHVFGPPDWDEVAAAPALITFHRDDAERETAYALSRRLARLGYVAISFEYTTPPLVQSASWLATTSGDALRWLRENSALLKIDPTQVAAWASGNQCEARLPLVLRSFCEDARDEPGLDDMCLSALILSVSCTSLEAKRSEDAPETASWILEVAPRVPRTVVLVPDDADAEQCAHVEWITDAMTRIGNLCEVVRYHSVPCMRGSGSENESKALASAMRDSLQSLGFRQAARDEPAP